MVIISVDLPAPLAPISVTISPSMHVEVDAAQRDDVAVHGLDAAHGEERSDLIGERSEAPCRAAKAAAVPAVA